MRKFLFVFTCLVLSYSAYASSCVDKFFIASGNVEFITESGNACLVNQTDEESAIYFLCNDEDKTFYAILEDKELAELCYPLPKGVSEVTIESETKAENFYKLDELVLSSDKGDLILNFNFDSGQMEFMLEEADDTAGTESEGSGEQVKELPSERDTNLGTNTKKLQPEPLVKKNICRDGASFESLYGINIDSIKPSYKFSFENDIDLIDVSRKDFEKTVEKEILKKSKLESEEASSFKLISYNQIQSEMLDPNNEEIYDDQVFKFFECFAKVLEVRSSNEKREKATRLMKVNEDLLKLIGDLENISVDIQGYNHKVREYKNSRIVLEGKLKSNNKTIEKTKEMIESEKMLFSSNIEAHTKYGVYVSIYKSGMNDRPKTIEEEIKKYIEADAAATLGGEYINSDEKFIEGKNGEVEVDSTISARSKGIISIRSSKKYNYKMRRPKLRIKGVKYQPAFSDDDETKAEDMGRIQEYQNKYNIKYIKRESDIDDFFNIIGRVYNKPSEKPNKPHYKKAKQKILEILHDYNEKNDAVAKDRQEVQERHKNRLVKLNQKIEIITAENEEIAEDIASLGLKSQIELEKAEEKLKESDVIIEEITKKNKELSEATKDSFYVSISDFYSFQDTDGSLKSRLVSYIMNVIEKIKQNYSISKQTAESTIHNGFFVKDTSKNMRFKRYFKKIYVYTEQDEYNEDGQWQIVMKVDAQIVPDSELGFMTHENKKSEISKSLNGIKKYNEQLHKPVDIGMVDIEVTGVPEDSSHELVLCDKCIIADKSILNFEYFENYDVLDDILYGVHASVEDFASTVTTSAYEWTLPNMNDIKKLLKEGNAPFDVDGKVIYVGMKDAPEKLVIKKDFLGALVRGSKVKLVQLDRRDEAYIVLKAK